LRRRKRDHRLMRRARSRRWAAKSGAASNGGYRNSGRRTHQARRHASSAGASTAAIAASSPPTATERAPASPLVEVGRVVNTARGAELEQVAGAEA
jgi:hypothetical protein